MNTKMAPRSVRNGMGYVAPTPAAMTCSVQVPSMACACGERATQDMRDAVLRLEEVAGVGRSAAEGGAQHENVRADDDAAEFAGPERPARGTDGGSASRTPRRSMHRETAVYAGVCSRPRARSLSLHRHRAECRWAIA